MLCKFILTFGFCSLCYEFVWSKLLNLNEGSHCTWKGKKGKCVNLYRCVSAVIDIENKEPPPTCTLESNEPVICCTDCLLVNDTRKLIYDKKIGIHSKTGLVSQDYCLEMLHELDYPCKRVTYTRIHRHFWKTGNCYAVKPVTKRKKSLFNPFAWKEELTHLAMLGYGLFEETLQWHCGGSLISDMFILTAARCLQNSFSGRVTHAGLGVRKRSDSVELWQRYKIIKTFPYPGHKPSTMYHDIALLKTAVPVLFNYHVTPICLPQPFDINKQPAMAASIGKVINKEEHLVNPCFVYLNKFSKNKCKNIYPDVNSTTQLCYGFNNRKKVACESVPRGCQRDPITSSVCLTCFKRIVESQNIEACQLAILAMDGLTKHDRGAPLFKRNGHYPCGFSIIGITSFERTWNNNGSFHGLYTNVFYYKSWIEKVVWSKRRKF